MSQESEEKKSKKLKKSDILFARPYFSPIGWTLLAVCVPITVVVFLMLNGVINDQGFLLEGLHIGIWVLTAILYLVNELKYGPDYDKRLTSKNTRKGGQLDEYVCEGESPDENVKRERLLNYYNDQWLLRFILLATFFIVLFLGIYMGMNGGIMQYQPLPAVPTTQEFQNYIVYKCYQLITLAIFGGAFIVLMYTGSDFIYRQMVILSNHHESEQYHPLPASSKYAMQGVNVLRDHDD